MPARGTNNGQVYFAGWERTPGGNVGGGYSNILNYSSWVQPGSRTVAWVGLSKDPSTAEWAQVGWHEYPGDVRNTFVQWTVGPGQYITPHLPAAEPVNAYTYYTVLWNYEPGKFTFYAAGRRLEGVNASFTPNQGENFGEIKTLASQMPGGYSNPEYFSDTHVWYANAWRNFDGSVFITHFGYHSAVRIGTTDLGIHDKACPT